MELATVRLICLCPKFWVESLPSEASGNLPKNGVNMAFFWQNRHIWEISLHFNAKGSCQKRP